ncbi:protein phosphatase 1K, mitochondrial isoform X2 [Sus scrofa]|uniref:protein phosphatase 1K, mitochondrial isoform X2 n=1 Tax=Sus scrofa TaxID=9823 RepID=UPI000A2B14D8|nr:protein phosphatase 1K, mitochondrial isoform X2 [Sus scrofa]
MESKRRRVPRGGERNASEPGCQSGCSVRRFFPFRGLEQRVGAGLSLTLAEPRAAGLSCTDSALGLNLTAGWRRLRSECGGLGRKEEETSEGTTDARRQHLPARVSLSRGPESPSSKPRTRGCRGARAPRRRCCRGRAEGDGATAGICTRSGWLAGETARRKVRYPSRLQCRAVRTRCFLRVLPWPLICLSPGAAPRIANCPKLHQFSGRQPVVPLTFFFIPEPAGVMSTAALITLVRRGGTQVRSRALLSGRLLQDGRWGVTPTCPGSTSEPRCSRFDPDGSGRPATWDNFGFWDNRIDEPILLPPSIKYGKPIPKVSLANVGGASQIGKRKENEDRFDFAQLTDQILYFAVYDGHGGPAAADFCHTHMEQCILDLLPKEQDLETVLTLAFLEIDKAFARHAHLSADASAPFALLEPFL